jgi:hypothetical protein
MKSKNRISFWRCTLPFYQRPVRAAIISVLALGLCAFTAKADTWTGAGQWPINQIRDWTTPANWSLGAVPPGNDPNFFGMWTGPSAPGIVPLGDGQINLNGQQSAGQMNFFDFSYPTIVPGVNPNLPFISDLTMVDSVPGGTFISMGEGVRDTYGVDYFTAGPLFTADVNINILNPVNAALEVYLGTGSANSSMMFSGQINNLNNNALYYNGTGNGTSLWISSNNAFNGSPNNYITVAAGFGGNDGTAVLHLVDAGRMDFTPINLQEGWLGLQDNTGGGAGGVQYPGNQYFNWVWSQYGNIFTDRSYQQSDFDTSTNVLQWLEGGVTDYKGMINFGSTARFGRTNNGFSLRLSSFDWEHDQSYEQVHVNNGNLTADRGGSRYISGANRLQEAHNYVFVDILHENTMTFAQFEKFGTGVLVVDNANGTNNWLTTPQVWAGVLSLGAVTNTVQTAPGVQLASPDAGVGIGWNTPIDLSGFWGPISPFPINPAAIVPGQSGAVDIDLWGYNAGIIDTNFLPANTYLRLASSKGGDATFDPQPNPNKHASISLGTTIIPYFDPQGGNNLYYFGGGGGTLRVDTIMITNKFPRGSKWAPPARSCPAEWPSIPAAMNSRK